MGNTTAHIKYAGCVHRNEATPAMRNAEDEEDARSRCTCRGQWRRDGWSAYTLIDAFNATSTREWRRLDLEQDCERFLVAFITDLLQEQITLQFKSFFLQREFIAEVGNNRRSVEQM
ncbi:hypothetical protein IE81DRAFT_331566 [Ceraceosorus guamensis]|uniref:Uncharacterized protein n=1 Tax=Ceraceosorus guamensis TaxID=1522189 RepID=A0A316VW61_9BASI|nr:hypothetical protein IE81DRAFT_331566 [Ceraceosorus guamensis]PWN40541.1 hypothetical protein IE81DRAFT_331566 [Ceraceosorus guamensis]